MKGVGYVAGFALVILWISVPSPANAGEKPRKTENIIFVMTDGLRWQEMFGGA